jgi:hypothetical protein
MSRLPSWKRWFTAAAVLVTFVATWACHLPANAGFTPTLHSSLQAVTANGSSAWPGPQGADISLIGVVINNPWDMLNYSDSASSPQWQVYIQAIDGSDFGGTALYMRKYSYMGPSYNYDSLGWYQEMDRLNHPNGVGAPLQRGDVIRVDARAPGQFYGGKYNINEMHSNDPNNNFDITVLQRGVTPVATAITLSYLKDASNSFIFDSTRATGCEHYQGSLVHLDNLSLVDDPSKWVLDGTVTVRQGNLTMPLKLGLHPELLSIAPTQDTRFSLTAILDQEDSGSPYIDNYRLWLTNASDLTVVPEPGTLALVLCGGMLMYPVVRRRMKHATE